MVPTGGGHSLGTSVLKDIVSGGAAPLGLALTLSAFLTFRCSCLALCENRLEALAARHVRSERREKLVGPAKEKTQFIDRSACQDRGKREIVC